MRNQPPQRVIDRLFASVMPAEWTDCIESFRAVGSHGYPHLSWSEGDGDNRTQTAHRIAWFDAHGPIPEGMAVDHMCHNRICVNIDHLRLLTPSENARANVYAARTHCPRGHAYDEANTYRQPSRPNARRCRQCAKDREAVRVRCTP